MAASTTSPNPNDKIQQTVSRIENGEQQGNQGSTRLLDEVHQLRQADSQNGSLDKQTFKADLASVTAQLHKDGVLPNIDLVEAKNGDAAARGVSEPGKSPDGGDPSLVTKSHGTTFTYNDQGEVHSYSKGKDTWTYDKQDGQYHESIDGKATNKTNSDIISVNGNGTETVTNPDGSTTAKSRWGGTLDRNADGQITKEKSGHGSKTFDYQNGQLTSMTDEQKGKPAETYTKASDGKFYAASDTDHKNPMDISVEPENAEGKPSKNGVVEITDNNGNTTDEHWGGTNVHYDSQHQLTSIDYSNGNKATDFKYGAASLDPSGNPLTPDLTGFTMTGQDGKAHTYTSSDGNISVDGGTAVPGTLTADANGALTATATGDGSDAQFKATKFGLGGSVVESGKFNGQEQPEAVTSFNGKTSTYKYDSNGDLTAVDAHGLDLTKDGDKWVTKNGHDTNLTPTIDANGTFSVTRPDGTFDSWNADGSKIQGIPDTQTAIAQEAQDVQNNDGGGTDSNGGTNTHKCHHHISNLYQNAMSNELFGGTMAA
jgi:hypothetical protein